MMTDQAVTILGLAVTRLREFFGSSAAVQPLGGGTDTVWLLAGAEVVPPPWLVGDEDDAGDCSDCSPYLWVRLARRWRTTAFPEEALAAGCGVARAVTIEAGIARCHPLDGRAEDLEQHAAIQWDDSWRIDNALCLAMRDAEKAEVALNTALGAGEPWGPEGMALVWTQSAHAQLAGGR